MQKNNQAKLILVGAGPGDPELMTIKGLKAIKTADVILYDSLVNLKIFDFAFGENFDINNDENIDRFVFVGKRKNSSKGKQEEINSLILKFLKQGKTVLRLKGGDPLVFARGIEEFNLATEHGFETEVIPGLTSGLSLASLNNVTITLREQSDSVMLVTAHDFCENKGAQWLNFISNGGTLIAYMGLSNIVDICNFFKSRACETLPVIAIENGSLQDQRIIETNIENLSQELIDKSFKSPVIFYLGKNIKAASRIKKDQLILSQDK